jgi:hypothetical protein
METVIASLISASVTLAVCLITNHAQAQKTQALIEYRLDMLTKEVQKHNGLIDRTYKLETDAIRHDDELKRINHRLNALEDDTK